MFETLATICEIGFLVCFGASWPFNIVRAYKARTAKGTSLPFMSLIALGYIMGILKSIFVFIGKRDSVSSPLKWVAIGFYIVNLSMVCIGIVIYFRNKKIDFSIARKEGKVVCPNCGESHHA